jgi:hypothetical protein
MTLEELVGVDANVGGKKDKDPEILALIKDSLKLEDRLRCRSNLQNSKGLKL